VKRCRNESAPGRNVAERHGLEEPLSAIELHLAPDSGESNAHVVLGDDRDSRVLAEADQSFVHEDIEHENRDHHDSSNDLRHVHSSSTLLEALRDVISVIPR
jgi:hypothetical protein